MDSWSAAAVISHTLYTPERCRELAAEEDAAMSINDRTRDIAMASRRKRLLQDAAEEMYEALQYIADKQICAGPCEMHDKAANLVARALSKANGW